MTRTKCRENAPLNTRALGPPSWGPRPLLGYLPGVSQTPPVHTNSPQLDRRSRAAYRSAAGLLLIQGVLMEGLVAVGAIVLIVLGIDQSVVTGRTQVFAFDYLQQNLYLMMAMSGIFAAQRIVGAVALWRLRVWGRALSLINCLVTYILMIFMLPAGIADGIFSGGALVLIVWAWFGRTPDGSARLIA